MADQKPPKDSSGRPALPPINRKSVESGLITLGAVEENKMPESAVRESINFNFDRIGGATLRGGTTLLGGNLTNPITGLYYFVDTQNVPAVNTQIIAVSGTVVWYLAAGTWTSKRTGLTLGSKARFATYLNFVFMVNSTEATAVWDGSGSSFSTSGNAASAPTGRCIASFRGRMWITGNSTYPDRLYYSTIPTAVTTPIITWNASPTTGQWIDISPNDGDTNTALQRFRQWLLVFKTNRIYRVFDIGQVDPDPYYAVGTSSQESVVETKTGVFFHHASGIYQFNVYGAVQEISRPVIDFIRAIPTSQYPSITGWLEPDGDHLCWAIGTVTVDGTTYTNCSLRYTISTMVWTHYSHPTPFVMSLRQQPLYTDGTSQYALVGDSAGNVLKTNTGLTDNGVPISYSLIHRWDNADGLLSTRKTVMVANFSHYRGAGTTVVSQTEKNDPDSLQDWTQRVGTLGSANTGFNTVDIKARKFRFRLFGQSTGQPFVYNGYELIGVTNEFLQFPKN